MKMLYVKRVHIIYAVHLKLTILTSSLANCTIGISQFVPTL